MPSSCLSPFAIGVILTTSLLSTSSRKPPSSLTSEPIEEFEERSKVFQAKSDGVSRGAHTVVYDSL